MSPLSATGLASRCRAEVGDLHAFFERWLSGRAESDRLERVERVLAPGFRMVAPDGDVRGREELLELLRAARGANGADFRIHCDAVEARLLSMTCCLVTYREWQSEGADECALWSTAILVESRDAPYGVEWLHVHETWLGGDAPRAAS